MTKPNRLINEKSPYLQQHAHNPVDWYPWGEEALARARAEKKPIFLSIGYSTCHWCHVMEHESFEDSTTAEVMNRSYVNIKVDREERPDLDHVYMTAVQMMTGSGGWPMSVWLTPELKPFFAGTYFPPDERYGRPGFKALMAEIGRVWTEDNPSVLQSAEAIAQSVKGALLPAAPPSADALEAISLRNAAFHQLEQSFDTREGGFGRAPKFPMPGYLSFLLYYYGKTRTQQALAMVKTTWQKMAAGGLYDQLGGGFARYSTDDKWLVPHFEKMLYDNTQLAMVGTHLFQETQDPMVRTVVEETLAYLVRDLRHPDGGFYSAEDADSEGREGKFYVWTLAELVSALPADLAELAIRQFGVTPNGNFLDPHTGELGQNILVRTGLVPPEAQEKFREIRRILFEIRSRRIRPHRDEKILTEWNGLAISAFARAGRAFLNSSWTEIAGQTASFLKTRLWDPASSTLYRRWRDGERKIPAFQSDYAFLVQGLLDLFEATGSAEWLEWAQVLHERMNRLFFDEASGGYFQSAESPDLLARFKEDQDNVIPSGNSVAALNGLRLGRLLDNRDFLAKAEATLRYFSRTLNLHPMALLQLLVAASVAAEAPKEVVVTGDDTASELTALLAVTARVADPGISVVPLSSGPNRERLAKLLPATTGLKAVPGRVAAYVCAHFACQAPTVDPEELARLILPR